MKITKFGHACLLIEEDDVTMLIDPGTFSSGFEDLEGIAAVLYTHKHADHYDPEALTKVLKTNPGARVIADIGTTGELKAAGFDVETARAGDGFKIKGVTVEAIGSDHAVMHPDWPVDPNVGYLVAGRLFHAGDNYVVPEQPVEILAFASVAPWSKVSEAAEYVRAVSPKVALPVHDAITTAPQMYVSMIRGMTQGHDVQIRELADGETIEL